MKDRLAHLDRPFLLFYLLLRKGKKGRERKKKKGGGGRKKEGRGGSSLEGYPDSGDFLYRHVYVEGERKKGKKGKGQGEVGL